MQMIDVLKRLAELDSKNPNVKNPTVQPVPVTSVAEGAQGQLPQLPELNDLDTLKALSGYKVVTEDSLNECGIMPSDMGRPQPASFSLNATAASGDEVASMLTQIMNLAGVRQHDPMGHAPADHDMDHGADDGVITGEPMAREPDSIAKAAAQGPMGGGGGEIMRAMMDKMNDITPEEDMMSTPDMDSTPPMPSTNLPPVELEDGSESDSPVASMADEVRDMADELADVNDEKTEESYSNTPEVSMGSHDTNAHAYQPNQGSASGRGFMSNPKGRTTSETIEAELMAAYKDFISESKKKCNHTPKGKQCPVHGLEECGMSEGWESKRYTGWQKDKERSYSYGAQDAPPPKTPAPQGAVWGIKNVYNKQWILGKDNKPMGWEYLEDAKAAMEKMSLETGLALYKHDVIAFPASVEHEMQGVAESMDDLLRLSGLAEAKKPSAGLSKKQKSAVVKQA